MKKDKEDCTICFDKREVCIDKCLNCNPKHSKFNQSKGKMNKENSKEKILEYIKEVYKKGNYTPSYAVMAEHFICSKDTISQYMIILESEGEIVFNPKRRAYFLKQS